VQTFCQVRSEKVWIRTFGSQQLQEELCVKSSATIKRFVSKLFHAKFDKKFARVNAPLAEFQEIRVSRNVTYEMFNKL
jgi:hypothetical protein